MPTLRPEHLIGLEHRLVDFLRPILPFSTASLYFPQPDTRQGTDDQSAPAQAVLDRDVLLIPLLYFGKRLGMLRLSGVSPEQTRPLVPVLPHLLSPCLQSMDLERKLNQDPLTGVLRPEAFFQRMRQQILDLTGHLQPGLGSVEDPGRRPDFALVIVDITRMSALNRRIGHVFGDTVLKTAAQAIQESAGPHSLVARIQGDSFVLLLPGVGPRRLPVRAEKIAKAVRGLRFSHPASRAPISPEISMGGASFPQDLSGSFLQVEADIQARHLLDLAREGQTRALNLGRQDVVTPAQILQSCGRITEVISSSRVRIDLGSEHGARSGQHFQLSVHAAENVDDLGSELRLIHTERTTSLGELIIPPPGENAVQPGDRVYLIESPGKYALTLPDEVQAATCSRLQVIADPQDFFTRWAAFRSQFSRFTVSLISSLPSSLADIVHALQVQAQEHLPRSSMVSGYGLGSLLLFFPDHSPEETVAVLMEVFSVFSSHAEQELCAGIGFYPCMNITRGETLGLAKQALEHARLLPFPQLAVFDSTTLTLQGDRAFARNELRQAMHAYNQALLLDETNAIARNSLAICLAQVGELNQACTEFRRILDMDASNYMAEYNYGYVCLKLQERELARACFQRCLELMPGHSYSLLRLGQMAEEEGELKKAGEYYRQAAKAGQDQSAPNRVLGRLAWKAGDRDRARQHLHQALVAAPQDPEALRLLARLTLEQGDDPEVAESLIRRSLGVQPDNPESLELLDWAVGKRDE